MSILTKYRVLNFKRLIIVSLFLVGAFLSCFFLSGLYEVTLGFDFNASDIANNPYKMQQTLLEQVKRMDRYTDINMFTTTVFPILVFSTGLFFYREKVGVFPYLFLRKKSQIKEVGKAMFFHSLFSAVSFYLAYIVFMTIGYCYIGPVTGDVPRNLFDGIFGTGFSFQHIYSYYLLEGFYKYFVFSFIYSLFVCCIALLVRRQYLCMVVPICYYFGVNIVIGNNAILGSILLPFQPAYTLGFNGMVYDNPNILTPLKPLLPFIPILIFICIGIGYYTKRSERVEF